jgi:hypothetical protein
MSARVKLGIIPEVTDVAEDNEEDNEEGNESNNETDNALNVID